MTGIYKIESKVHPNRCYIGSACNLRQRQSMHLSNLRNNKHPNPKLQAHYNKYGEQDLQFSVLINCNKENLIITEQSFINIYKPWFNICKIAGSSLGVKRGPLSEEHKISISKSLKGCVQSVETIQLRKISLQKNAKERGKNISKGLMGHVCPQHVREKIRITSRKRKPSEETRAKLRIAHSKFRHTEETKLKMSELKKHQSLETRRKNSESCKKAWVLRKLKKLKDDKKK